MDIQKLTSSAPTVPAGFDSPRSSNAVSPQSAVASGQLEQAAGQQDSSVPLDKAVASMSSFIQSVQRNLDFSVDDTSGEVVIKVVDTESGRLVRQIPSEEALRLSEKLEELRSLMFETRA